MLDQTTQAPNYSCSDSDEIVTFTASQLSHSAWEPTSNCILQSCNVTSSTNNTCRSSATLCFQYRTLNNQIYCAPGILCSILELCNERTNNCISNTSVCIVNSCCSPQAVCLPVSLTSFCNSSKNTHYFLISSHTSTRRFCFSYTIWCVLIGR